MTESQQIHLIGMGQVGRRLGDALTRSGFQVHPVRRDQGWDAALDPEDPSIRLLTMREEDLGAALSRFEPRLRDRLVLVQNGFLEPVVGALDDVTRGLIYFTSKQDLFRVLCPSPFHGPLASVLVRGISTGGIPCSRLEVRNDFVRAMIVKGIWNAVVGLPLSVHGVDLETYLRDFGEEFRELTAESARAASAHYRVDLDGAEAVRKILATTGELGAIRGGAKALAFRNGAIAWFGRCHGVPTPVNDGLLQAVGYDPARSPSDAVGERDGS